MKRGPCAKAVVEAAVVVAAAAGLPEVVAGAAVGGAIASPFYGILTTP